MQLFPAPETDDLRRIPASKGRGAAPKGKIHHGDTEDTEGAELQPLLLLGGLVVQDCQCTKKRISRLRRNWISLCPPCLRGESCLGRCQKTEHVDGPVPHRQGPEPPLPARGFCWAERGAEAALTKR